MLVISSLRCALEKSRQLVNQYHFTDESLVDKLLAERREEVKGGVKLFLMHPPLLALLKNEPGADKIEPLLGNIVMSSINVSETASILLESEMTPQVVQECLLPLISVIVPFDEEQAFNTAELRKQTKIHGLSLGDRACISLGMKMNLPVYTVDRIWQKLHVDNLDIKLIR
jgi:PIN domain nuclease of toxin-antitoxin system